MIKQESFTPTDHYLIPEIVQIAEREKQTKSKMIDILLHAAVKERNRKRVSKKVSPLDKKQ